MQYLKKQTCLLCLYNPKNIFAFILYSPLFKSSIDLNKSFNTKNRKATLRTFVSSNLSDACLSPYMTVLTVWTLAYSWHEFIYVTNGFKEPRRPLQVIPSKLLNGLINCLNYRNRLLLQKFKECLLFDVLYSLKNGIHL